MAKYRVNFRAEAYYSIVVEADSEEDAETAAYEDADFPYFGGGMAGELDEWFLEDGSAGIEQVDDDEEVGDGRW